MKRLLFIGALAATLTAGAQESWSLQQCIDYAQANSTTIGQRTLAVEQQENQLSTDRFSRLPDLNASAGYNLSFGRATGQDNTFQTQTLRTGNFNLSTSVPVFQGFRINRTIAGDKLNLAAATADLERAREDLSVNVMTLYLQVLYNKEMVRVAEEQLSFSTAQLERSRHLVESGKQPRTTLFESEALVASDALSLTQSRNELQSALLDLSQALNRESAEGFDITEPALEPLLNAALATEPATNDAIYDQALAGRPRIAAERFRLESSRNAVSVAKSALYPTLSVGAGFGTGVYSSMDIGFWPQFRNNSSEYIGLNLSVPIFNRRATRNNIRQARIAVRQQELALVEAEQSLRKDIEQARFRVEAAGAKYSSAQAALHSAQEAFRCAEQKAEAGRSTVFDFNDAKNRLERATSELVQAKFELVFRRKILDYYRGEPLTLE